MNKALLKVLSNRKYISNGSDQLSRLNQCHLNSSSVRLISRGKMTKSMLTFLITYWHKPNHFQYSFKIQRHAT